MTTHLILVPGLLCDDAVWAHQSNALADLAHIHIAANGARDSLGAMADAIIATAPPRFAIAGHSMGGRVALEVMRRAPERVTALALLDTGYKPLAAGEAGKTEVAGRMTLVEKARREGMLAMGREWLRGMLHPARLTDTPLVNTILDMITRATPELYAAQTRALIGRPDASGVLTRITCPTLVLCGHEDAWSVVRQHDEIRTRIGGSELVVIADCGHMSTLERPAQVSQALRAWLSPVAQG